MERSQTDWAFHMGTGNDTACGRLCAAQSQPGKVRGIGMDRSRTGRRGIDVGTEGRRRHSRNRRFHSRRRPDDAVAGIRSRSPGTLRAGEAQLPNRRTVHRESGVLRIGYIPGRTERRAVHRRRVRLRESERRFKVSTSVSTHSDELIPIVVSNPALLTARERWLSGCSPPRPG